MILDDQLSKQIRLREITPEVALGLLRDDQVYVYASGHADPGSSWEEVEDGAAGFSDIQHALNAVGAAALADAFSEEIRRARDEGRTIESLLQKLASPQEIPTPEA